MTPTQRSIAKLKADGYIVANVEKWIPQIRQRKDAFGFGDLLCSKIGVNGALLVQTTSGSNVSARLAKIRGIAEARIWIASGNAIHVHGWKKSGPRGQRKVWTCRVENVEQEEIL